MNKKVIKISENKLQELVQEKVNKILTEKPAIDLSYYDTISQNDNIIMEMSRINAKEPNGSIFPYEVFNVHIWSNDYNPPHFHILKDDWDVEFYIENGNFYKIKSQGKDKKVYSYMCRNVKEWLESICYIQPKLTNKENAILQWEQLHSQN